MTDASLPAVPSLARRFGALLLDWMLCVLVAGIFARPMVDGWAPVVVLIAEYTFFVGLFGQTPGMRLAKITCLGDQTGQPVGLLRGALRGILLALVIPALVMDPERRGLHDRAAGTIIRPAV
ncbi:RDD family protein [Catellatospora tritici]|uniref:RDD family protein n=1 Tax=Catellatospora tritici TaxID=2851566 RepID=UPI0027DEFFE0|nr:RDD family protein [Catellatospora tritici]